MKILFFLIGLGLICPLYNGQAVAAELIFHEGPRDVIVRPARKSDNDRRLNYPNALLKEALLRTNAVDESFAIETNQDIMSLQRSLRELMSGNLGVVSTEANPEWEQKTIPIYIPIRKGLQGYRLALIRSEDQNRFSNIQTKDQLLNLAMGTGSQWGITKAFLQQNFTVVKGINYEGLFQMLRLKRFDYLSRGLNEIYRELQIRQELYPSLSVEDSMAIYIPNPTYFFVTPTRPDLAQRIEKGLEIMIADGTFDRLFLQFHKKDLERAKLESRRVFRFDNKLLTTKTPLKRAELWYSPNFGS